MKKIFFCLLFIPLLASGQESFNMNVFSNYDDPALPTRSGLEYNDCWAFRHDNGTEVAIIGGTEDILFFDITSPANPVLIYTYHVLNMPSGTVNQSVWRDFKTYGNYLYASADEGTSGLLIFNMSQVPASITMVKQTVAFWNRTHNIFIDETNGMLYAAGSNSVSNGLVILDLTGSPANPSLESNVPLTSLGGGYVHDVYVRDGIAYCSHGGLAKIHIYDFSDLPAFSLIGSIDNYPGTGYNHSSWLNEQGTALVMCDETHGSPVKLVDVTDPTDISSDDFKTFSSELLGPDAPGSSIAHNPFVLSNLAYIAYYHEGVQVFDITDPDNIELFAYYDTNPDNVDYFGYKGCWGVYPFLPSGVIVASDVNNGLFLMELINPPLAVTFLTFDAFRENKTVKLEWTIANASFGNLFNIMRSTDGGVTFQTIGSVDLSEGISEYEFIDQNIAGSTNYVYRVDFIQTDGSKITSPIRYVRTAPSEKFFNVVNPISSSLQIQLLKPVESVDLSVFNMEGKIVWQQQVAQPSSNMEFSMIDLPVGQYALVIKWEGGSENLIIGKIN